VLQWDHGTDAATEELQMNYHYIPTDREEERMRESGAWDEMLRELEAIHPDDRTDEDYRDAGMKRPTQREER